MLPVTAMRAKTMQESVSVFVAINLDVGPGHQPQLPLFSAICG